MASASSATPVIISDPASISGFNRGPITSLFVPAPSCTATVSLVDGRSAYYVGHYGGYFDPDCYPTGSSAAEQPALNWDKYYYSPAICPSGWSIATRFPSLVPAAPPRTSYTVNSDTTAALCCPSGYVYYTMGHQCTSTVPAGQDLTVNSYSLNGMTFATSLKIIPQISRTVVVNDGIPIMWQASDSAVLARATITSSTPQSTTSLTPTASPSITGTPSQSSGGLSTGAKIGLGVGIPVAVIALLAMGFLLWKRRQKSQTVPELATAQHAGYKDAPYAHGNYQQGNYLQGNYQQGAYQQENYHQGQPHYEMQTDPVERNNPHELPATRH